MSGALQLVLFSILPTAAVTVLSGWLISRFFPGELAGRYGLAVPAAAGFLAGYILLPDWAPLTPERHWQWLPYLALVAAFIGPASLASGLQGWERATLNALLAILAAWLLVPTWETLSPSRPIWIAIVATFITALSLALAVMPERIIARTLLPTLALATVVIAGWLAIDVSLKLGQLALLAFVVVASSLLVHWLTSKNRAQNLRTHPVRGFVLCYSLLAVGLAFVGAIEPQPPRLAMLVLPALPLLAWFGGGWNKISPP